MFSEISKLFMRTCIFVCVCVYYLHIFLLRYLQSNTATYLPFKKRESTQLEVYLNVFKRTEQNEHGVSSRQNFVTCSVGTSFLLLGLPVLRITYLNKHFFSRRNVLTFRHTLVAQRSKQRSCLRHSGTSRVESMTTVTNSIKILFPQSFGYFNRHGTNVTLFCDVTYFKH